MADIYTVDTGFYQITVDHYTVDGFQIELSYWDGEDFKVLFDKRMIFYSVYDAVIKAFEDSGIDYGKAIQYAEEMGIEPDLDEEDE